MPTVHKLCLRSLKIGSRLAIIVLIFMRTGFIDEIEMVPEASATSRYSSAGESTTRFAVQSYLKDAVLKDDDATCDTEHTRVYFADSYWDEYRFSDYFYGHLGLYKQDPQKNKVDSYHLTYPGSLVDDYHRQAFIVENVGVGNFTVLQRLVNERARRAASFGEETHQQLRVPHPNTLVVHLRLGDVVDAAVDSVEDLLSRQRYFYRKSDRVTKTNAPWKAPLNKPLIQAWNAYVRPLSYYSEKIDSLNAVANYTSVVIMGSAHMGQVYLEAELRNETIIKNVTKSCQYTKALQAFFANAMPQADVTLRLGNPPDDDVVFASQAAEYLPSGGGFSRIVERLNKMNRKQVSD